jgi:hypothetical protein
MNFYNGIRGGRGFGNMKTSEYLKKALCFVLHTTTFDFKRLTFKLQGATVQFASEMQTIPERHKTILRAEELSLISFTTVHLLV